MVNISEHLSTNKIKILFLCTGNSARSQMAEAWARSLKGDIIEPFSAGIEAHGINPLTIEAMKEVGIDMSKQRSKHVSELVNIDFDYVITLCSDAESNCPIFPGKTTLLHYGFEDPAKAKGNHNEKLTLFRKIRDEIKNFVEDMPNNLIKTKNCSRQHTKIHSN